MSTAIDVPAKKRTGGYGKYAAAWRDEFYVKCHELARAGHSELAISQSLGISEETWHVWKKTKPALLDAIKRGKADGGDGVSFQDYVYKRLSPEIKEKWEQLKLSQQTMNADEIRELLLKFGKKARQHLFIHAILTSGFNMSKACYRTCTSLDTFIGWMR